MSQPSWDFLCTRCHSKLQTLGGEMGRQFKEEQRHHTGVDFRADSAQILFMCGQLEAPLLQQEQAAGVRL
jgi:hypothetical protein